MTKQEYKIILKLIDRNTATKQVGYYQYEEHYITATGIARLKQDIKDLFEGYCDETNGAEYAERIMKAIDILQRADTFKNANTAIPLAIQVLLGKETKNYDKEIETL